MKRIISLFVVISMLVMGAPAKAGTGAGNVISFDKAKSTLLLNNRILQKLDNTEKKTQIQYNKAVLSAQAVNIDGIKASLARYGMQLDGTFEVMLKKQKELLPEQLKYYWMTARNSKVVTQQSLVAGQSQVPGLRDIYLGLLKADFDFKIKQQRFNLKEEIHNQNKAKLEQGLITGLDLEQSDYDLLKAKKDMEAAARDRENLCRSLNSFLGVPVDTVYDTIIYSEKLDNSALDSDEAYVEKALSERLEILNQQKEIELKELEKSIEEENQLNQRFTKVAKEYEDILVDIESRKLKLEKGKSDIRNEIKGAYIDVKKEAANIENLQGTLDMQKRSLEKLKAQYASGLLPGTAVREMEIGVNELENGLKLAIYNYNTKLMKFKNAAGLGPGY